MGKLLNIFELSKAKGRPVRQLRSFVAARKIPCLKVGHRTMLFDIEKVEKALERFEIPAIEAKEK
jgi:hypothetical protein